tara:strand:- start:229 stop:606 length:378 start_codon:yes stop_codon:yes gene_type:complete
MTVNFSRNITIKIFNDKNLNRSYVPRIKKCKEYDGPNDFSILWNQIIILYENNIITNSESLKRQFDEEILKIFSKQIYKELDNIIYKFLYTDKKIISLYHDTFRLIYYDGIIDRLKNLRGFINEI